MGDILPAAPDGTTGQVSPIRAADPVDVCPEEWSEGLDELEIADGIGLFPHPVEVHVAQAGTLGNLVALAQDGVAPTLLGIDEDTSLLARPDGTWTSTVAER